MFNYIIDVVIDVCLQIGQYSNGHIDSKGELVFFCISSFAIVSAYGGKEEESKESDR